MRRLPENARSARAQRDCSPGIARFASLLVVQRTNPISISLKNEAPELSAESYRDWEPSESLNLANIDVNGSYFGSVANGGVFYRDVLPGHYHITPQSYGQDFDQDQDVDLSPGQQVYGSVASLRSWEEGGDVAVFERDWFEAGSPSGEQAKSGGASG